MYLLREMGVFETVKSFNRSENVGRFALVLKYIQGQANREH